MCRAHKRTVYRCVRVAQAPFWGNLSQRAPGTETPPPQAAGAATVAAGDTAPLPIDGLAMSLAGKDEPENAKQGEKNLDPADLPDEDTEADLDE